MQMSVPLKTQLPSTQIYLFCLFVFRLFLEHLYKKSRVLKESPAADWALGRHFQQQLNCLEGTVHYIWCGQVRETNTNREIL